MYRVRVCVCMYIHAMLFSDKQCTTCNILRAFFSILNKALARKYKENFNSSDLGRKSMFVQKEGNTISKSIVRKYILMLKIELLLFKRQLSNVFFSPKISIYKSEEKRRKL